MERLNLSYKNIFHIVVEALLVMEALDRGTYSTCLNPALTAARS